MTLPETKNLPASIHQRLLNKARASSRPCDERNGYSAIARFTSTGQKALALASVATRWGWWKTKPELNHEPCAGRVTAVRGGLADAAGKRSATKRGSASRHSRPGRG